MTLRLLTRLSGILLVLGLWVGAGHAQPVKLKGTLALTAQGGVSFKTPKWVVAGPQKPDIAVLRNDGIGDEEAFLILMLSIEEGPKVAPPWERIRSNIVQAARRGGASLTLELKEDVPSLAGFRVKRMAGTLSVNETTLAVDIVTLFQSGRLVTVSLVSAASTPRSRTLALDVAATTRLTTAP
jgi:hypothetical protein